MGYSGRLHRNPILICVFLLLIVTSFIQTIKYRKLSVSSSQLFLDFTQNEIYLPQQHLRSSNTIHCQDNDSVDHRTMGKILDGYNNNTGSDLLVQYGDFIYTRNDWDGAPVVVPQFRLIFFTSAKVGCTTWKQLFRRMMNKTNWNVQEYQQFLPWNPEVNGLTYLYDYNREQASDMMTSPHWTRAIFVRDPKERFLSAYLDKVISNQHYVQQKCCPYIGRCVEPSKSSIDGFLPYLYTCTDAHWRPQHKRMEDKYWPYINFVGHMENVQQDAERLLQQIGAWDEYGKAGWGIGQNESIFEAHFGGAGRHHATDARTKLKQYLTPKLETILNEFYSEDYNNRYMNITKISFA